MPRSHACPFAQSLVSAITSGKLGAALGTQVWILEVEDVKDIMAYLHVVEAWEMHLVILPPV